MRAMVWLAGLVAALAGVATPAAPPPKPKLIVAISIDQFSADLFAQYRGRFTGGLARMQQGVVFPSGYQSHAATETCPGHSTILSGMHPAGTGIVGNSVWSPIQFKMVYCLDDGETPVAGMKGFRSPAVLKAPTLGAWMKDADPRSRVFAVAGKDRAAVPMGGARNDGEYWWNEDKGGYTTYVPEGTTDAARLAPIAAFNEQLFKTWRQTPPAWVIRDQRCAALAGPQVFGGKVFDAKVPPGGWTPPAAGKDFAADPAFQAWFRANPEFDRVTLELARHVIDTQQLGQREATDLIAIGLSATDYVGHRFGPEGPEMCDQLAWLDARLGTFLDYLDGLKIPYVVVLTADHGSIDAAERAARRGIPAERINTKASPADLAAGRLGVLDEVNADLHKDIDFDYDLQGDATQIVIGGQTVPDLRAKVVAGAIAKLRQRPEIAAVFTKDEALAGKAPDSWTLAEIFAASTDAERSGEIQVAWKEFATPFRVDPSRPYIAGHGSPWNYDRRVTILFWWPGATGFEQPLAVETVDTAPTLAAVAGVKAPPVDGRCLDLDAGAGDSCAVKP